ncbi:MAG: glutaredoxin domain-containing protein [Candidatus Omnitrophota bacterium]
MAKNVKIYSTSTCSYCVMAKKYLKDNNIEFENIDVGSDPQAGQEMMEKSGQMGVPVLDIDGEIVVGFDKTRIASLLGI